MAADLHMAATDTTPHVAWVWATGALNISGESYPEYPGEFYMPLLEWLDSFLAIRPAKVVFCVYLTYFNTASSKCLWDMLEKLDTYQRSGGQVQVVWRYDADDVDALDAGKDLNEDLGVPFSFEEVA